MSTPENKDSLSKRLADWSHRNRELLEHVSSLSIDRTFEHRINDWISTLTEIDKLSREGIGLLEEWREKVVYAAGSLFERQMNARELASEIQRIYETNVSCATMGPGIVDVGIPEPYPFDSLSSLIDDWKAQASLYHDIEDCFLQVKEGS